MNIVDIIAIVIILLGGLLGFKKGSIKGIVNLIGLITISILACQFKGKLAGVFIKYLPFYSFKGFEELYTLNFMLYDVIAFTIIFVLLYCFLNILLNLSGLVELLTKFNIVFKVPDKIAGVILGMVESLIFVFVLAFIAGCVPQTQKYVYDSSVTKNILEKTPIMTTVFAKSIANSMLTNDTLTNRDGKETTEINLEIIRNLIRYEIVSSSVINESIDNGNLHLNNVVIAS